MQSTLMANAPHCVFIPTLSPSPLSHCRAVNSWHRHLPTHVTSVGYEVRFVGHCVAPTLLTRQHPAGKGVLSPMSIIRFTTKSEARVREVAHEAVGSYP